MHGPAEKQLALALTRWVCRWQPTVEALTLVLGPGTKLLHLAHSALLSLQPHTVSAELCSYHCCLGAALCKTIAPTRHCLLTAGAGGFGYLGRTRHCAQASRRCGLQCGPAAIKQLSTSCAEVALGKSTAKIPLQCCCRFLAALHRFPGLRSLKLTAWQSGHLVDISLGTKFATGLPQLEELQLQGLSLALDDGTPALTAVTALDMSCAPCAAIAASIPRLERLRLHSVSNLQLAGAACTSAPSSSATAPQWTLAPCRRYAACA